VKTLATMTLVIALAACGKKTEKGPPVETGSGSAVVATGSGSAAPDAGNGSAAGSGSAVAADEQVEVPTEVDFEAKATEEITDKNVDAKLKALETQLAPQ